MSPDLPQVSVVVPVYRSEDCLAKLVEALTAAFEKSDRSHEIVLVNDCSPDRSWDKIVELAAQHSTIRGVSFRKNFGQDSALMAGLRTASGDVVVIMDDDLQHDPEDMEMLLSKVEEGFDVCYAQFVHKEQALWKNLGSWFNGKVANIVIGKPDEVYLSPYKAIARSVVDEIVKYDGPYPYVDGLLFRATTNITQVDAQHHTRYAGESNYNLIRSVNVWLKLATSFSLMPLRTATCLGFVFSSLGVALGTFFVIRRLVLGAMGYEGWASMMVAILVLGGVQLACLGLIGEYLGRVFLHLNRRPQYVVKETLGVAGGARACDGQLPSTEVID